jgi:uncharacterized protein YjbJ (UPF0337 family)
MNKNQASGAAEEVKGKVEQGIGKVTGDEQTKAQGKADEMKGKAKKTAGNVEHDVKSAAGDIRNKVEDTTR